MTIAEKTTEDCLRMLREDGDIVLLPDGRTVRLRIEPDHDTIINDFDCWGKVGWEQYDRSMGYHRRPDGFDGNSERMSYGNSDPYWWQPPADGPKRGTPEFDALRREVQELCEFGFVVLILEVLDGDDAYGNGIVVNYTALGGVVWGQGFTWTLGDMLHDLSV